MRIQFTALSLATISLLAGCATTPYDTGSPDSESQEEALVHLSITLPDGTADDQDLSYADFVDAKVAALPEYVADGAPATRPEAILEASQSELTLSTGETLVLTREGHALRRTAPANIEGLPSVQVEWNDELDALFISGDGGVTVLEIAGIDDAAVRASVLGSLALDLLGGGVGIEGEVDVPRCDLVLCGTIVAVVVVGGYVTCVTAGNALCADAARRGCGNRGVRRFSQICGAGYDANGSFRLGFECTFVCR